MIVLGVTLALWVAVGVAGCASVMGAGPPPSAGVQAWQCGNRSLITHYHGDGLRVHFNGRSRDLIRVVSGSGEKYQDDNLLVWMKGDEALVEQYGRRWPACQLDRRESIWAQAQADGMLFRGLGNEPGWVVEIWPDRIRYLGEYGTTTGSWPLAQTRAIPDGRRYELGPDQWLAIHQQPCQDTMKGDRFDATVELHLGQWVLKGCGRSLMSDGALPPSPD